MNIPITDYYLLSYNLFLYEDYLIKILKKCFKFFKFLKNVFNIYYNMYYYYYIYIIVIMLLTIESWIIRKRDYIKKNEIIISEIKFYICVY